ncbi:hypothetical protein [uncultured Methanolobus sp.]|uniref:hypothetical protein n=1 Tax=uncultured Methanolobus sp. TaxID=218300 RepID=UPI002AABF1D5|nr:hypothetical protein [uncultured Methanolobus sp.]
MKLKIITMVLMLLLLIPIAAAAPDDNVPEWEITSISAPSAAAIDSEGTLFVLTEDGDLYRISDGSIEDSVSGTSSYDCDNTNLFLSPDDSQIYFYDDMFSIYAYNTDDLSQEWNYNTMYDGGMFGSSYGNIVVDSYGYIYVELSMSGSTVILKLDSEGNLIDESNGNEILTGAPGALTADGSEICYPESDDGGIAHYDTSDLSYSSTDSEFPAIESYNSIIPISLFDGEHAMSDDIGAIQHGAASAYGQAQSMQYDSSGNLIFMDYDPTYTYSVIRSYSDIEGTPTENWVYSMEDLYPNLYFDSSSFFLGSDNRLYMMPKGTSGNTGLFCLDLSDGALDWAYDLDDDVSATQSNNGVVIGDGFVVIAYDGGVLRFDISGQPLYCRTGAYDGDYGLSATFSQYQDGNYGHSMNFFYVTPDNSGSIVVNDNDGTGGFVADQGFRTLTGNVDGSGDYYLTIQGGIEEGCEIILTASNYDYYDAVVLVFDESLMEDLGYQVYVEDTEHEQFIATDGDYTLVLNEFSEATTVELVAVTGGGSSSASESTTESGDSSSDSGTDSITRVEITEEFTEFIESSNDLPTTSTTTATTIIANPVNWLVIIGAYLGAYIVISFSNTDVFSSLSATALYGTVGWILPLLVLMIGVNPFLFNYWLNSGSVLLGVLEFMIAGGILGIFSFILTGDTNGKKAN